MKNTLKITVCVVAVFVAGYLSFAGPASQKPRGYNVGITSTVIIPSMRPITKTVWEVTNAYTQGQYIKVPTNNNDVYWVLQGGTSGATEPNWTKLDDITNGTCIFSTVDIQRGKIYIQNWGSAGTVNFGFDYAAEVDKGLGLIKGGGSFNLDLSAYQGEVRAISSASTNLVTTQVLP